MLTLSNVRTVASTSAVRQPGIRGTRHGITRVQGRPVTHRQNPTGLVRAASATVPEDASVLAKQIMEAEQELQTMFQPGKPMPKAAVVARKRAEVENLRAQLEGRISALEKGNNPETAALAREVFAELEAYLKSGLMGHEDDQEVAKLEQENGRLRVKAHHLLVRRQKLEQLAQENNVRLPY